MREGLKIYDADTHVSASAEALEPYLSSRLLELVPDLETKKVPVKVGFAGEPKPEPYKHRYAFGDGGAGWGNSAIRVLGEAKPREGVTRPGTKFMGTEWPTEGGDEDCHIRIKDMDREGADVHMMVPSPYGSGHENPEVELEFIRALHRWLADFCAPYPHRLKSMIVVTPRSLEGSVEEIHRWGDSDWAVAVQPFLPIDYPVDHPEMDVIWKAAQDHNLAVVHHSFATGYPGYRDLWSNPFMGRSASHAWGAMRFDAAVLGSGILDRFPALRIATLESGFGWLPFWASRLDDQMEYVGFVADGLLKKPSEYMTSGRFFSSIEIHEGPKMMQMVLDLLGDDLLMMGSDYTHPESRFPESYDKVLAWSQTGISHEALTKLMWDNPVACFGEP